MTIKIHLLGHRDNRTVTGRTGYENLYDFATELGWLLIVHEVPFSYSYPDCECTFEIDEKHRPFLESSEFDRVRANFVIIERR